MTSVMHRSRTSIANGLARKRLTPRVSIERGTAPAAERTTMGIVCPPVGSRSRSTKSQPLSIGIIRSSTMASGPKVHYDLPVGGRRLMQQVDGYEATIVSGVVTQRGGKATGARPGRLVRGAQGDARQFGAAAGESCRPLPGAQLRNGGRGPFAAA